jgi:hypothetical protein
MNSLSMIGEQFRAALSTARTFRDHIQGQRQSEEKVHVVGAGATLTSAYEQLRNAAENTEEHLLLQNSIRRFYRQLLLTRDQKDLARSGDELAIELTLAGYVPNDTLTALQISTINKLAVEHGKLLKELRSRRIAADVAMRWVLDGLSVSIERELSDHTDDDVFMQFCYEYFRSVIDHDKLFRNDVPKDYDIALFMAVHRALLRSDIAVIRADLMRRYRISTDQPKRFIELSKHIDDVMDSHLVDKLYRVVDRQAAPERIVRRMLHEEVDVRQLLEHKSQFLSAFETQVEREYGQVSERIRRAIIRAVIFLFITKVIIGLAIEVPYDYAVHGHIVWLPLIVNLLFPPLYMALLSLTLGLPAPANTRALSDRIAAVLYAGDSRLQLQGTRALGRKENKAFTFSYVLFGLALIGLISWGLFAIGFSFLHLLIFFVFLSTASFLGFRLSHMIRELEVVDTKQSGLTFARDLFYLPFVVIGRWLSEKYAKVNVITLVLDMVIELPLKTILRLVRQWAVFITAKKDEI